MIRISKSRLAVSASIVVLTATLALTAPAFAAGDTATLQGHVTSAAGGTVTVTDTVTGRSTTAKVGADGSYVIVGLRPSSYHVTAGNASDDITLAIGETITLDLDAAAAPAAPEATTTVTVTGRRSKEVRTSEIATNVSNQQIENLPQNDRNFMNFAALAPGVTVSTDPNKKNFRGAGLGTNQVNVFIDGQSQKNQVDPGGVAGQNFSKGNPFPQLAIQEFKVSSQNFKAEFEQAGSAIITAVTKTGGTEFHGNVFYQLQNKDMIGQPFFQRGNPKPDYERKQFGFDVGGPIIKNTLHFYVAYEGTDQQNPSTAITFRSDTPTSIIAANGGSFADPFTQDLWFGKLTWFLNDADTLNFSYFDRSENNITDYGGNSARSHGRDLDTSTKQTLLEWNHRGDGWLNEMSLAYFETATGTPAITSGPEYVIRNANGDTVAELGAHFFTQFSSAKTTTFKNNLTLTGLEWHGDHVVKMGLKVASNTYDRNESWYVNGSYAFRTTSVNDTINTSSAIPYMAQIALRDSGSSVNDNTQVGLFIQDDWTFDEHWTFNLGIRWDYESNMMNNKFVTPAAMATALRNYQGWQAAGINPEDYISDGSNRDSFTGAFQPRLGFSYDFNGDRDTVLFGGWGRYYDRNLYNHAQVETQTDIIRSDVQVSFCGATGLPTCAANPTYLQWNESYRDPNALRTAVAATGAQGSVWLLNNKTRVPYSDQINLGIRKRFGDINTSFSVAQVQSYDVFAYVRGNRMPDGSYSPVGEGVIRDNFPAAGQLPGFSGKLNIGANDGKSKYNAFYITVDKAFTRATKYGYSATLTIADSKTMGNELDQVENFMGAWQYSNGYGFTQGVDRMRLVATGIVLGPWDTTVSGTLTVASGPAYGGASSVCNPSNPSDCYTKFNYNAGNFPDDDLAYQNLDLRIAKDFELPNGQVITVDGQVYNVFDHVNRVYSAWGGRENNTVGNARSYQVGLKYKW